MSDDYEEYRRKVIDAQRQWNYDRSAIYFAQAFVASKFDGDYEDPRIKGPDNYDTMTLAEMVQKVNDMKPELVEAAGNAWMQISTDIKDAAAAFNTEFQKTVGGEGKAPAWGGASGAKAVEAVNNYATRTEPLGTAAHLVGIKLLEMVTGLHQTKALMPTAEPPKDLDGKVLPPDGIMKEGDYTAEEAEDEGRRILRTVYGQVAHQTDHGVPVLPAAPKVVDDGPDQPYVPPGDGGGDENGGGEDGGGGGGETGGGTGGTGETGGGEDTGGGTGTEPEDTGTTAASAETQSTPQTTSTPTDTSRAATTGTTGTPSGTGYVPGGSGRSGSGSGSGFPGRGGGSGGGGSAGGSNQPGAGRSLPGGGQPQSGAAPAAAAAARGGAAGAGRAGMAGMPMGGMGGGRGGGQDEEKQGQSAIKDYLINQQNGEELTGLDSMPKTVPPVLGEG
ncbi:hypothetical protein IU438_15540 [Nocardia cyriacigeorgica]|uniref:hypothetical protein n=1 Tax=Nocardia cyriacigeorgica TaxID=135487 RepID=UPI001893641F|nr:hypothetical protein [Nocardia cyriacigeorgica]MBF6397202.1 hypothetical protein [Nocardia cyriacigeorgica]MBF6403140.1 hypothetical protein [Nocardia cyriacigeorgica]